MMRRVGMAAVVGATLSSHVPTVGPSPNTLGATILPATVTAAVPSVAVPMSWSSMSASMPAHWTTGLGASRRCIHIETSETPNPECLRYFSMELSFLESGQSMDMPNDGHAYKSPLAQMLFGIEGIKAVYFADEYMTITKETGAEWDVITPMVSEAVVSFAESGVNILSEEGEKEVVIDDNDTEPQLWDDEVILAIKELLASRIRPMLRGDGGNCRFCGFDDGSVYILLEGACKSCPSSGMTLKNGIERMLMHWIPEVVEVLEIDEDFAFDYQRQQKEAKEEYEKEHGPIETSEEAAPAQ